MACLCAGWKTFKNVIIVIFVLCMSVGRCYGNRVPYQHLPGSVGEIQVDQVVPLGVPDSVVTATGVNAQRHASRRKSLPVKGKDGKVAMETKNAGVDGRTNGAHERRRDRLMNKELLAIIEVLREEVKELKLSLAEDRQKQTGLEERLTKYHDETMVSIAEVVQIRQIATETYDKAQLLNDVVQDHSIAMEGFTQFQRDFEKENRRYHEYKERASKRFHQIENTADRLDKSVIRCNENLKKLTQEVQETIDNRVASLRDTIATVDRDIQERVTNVSNTTSECCDNTQKLLTDYIASRNSQYSNILNSNQGNQHSANQKPASEQPANQKPSVHKLTNEIKIVEFGSGEIEEELTSNLEELSEMEGLSTGVDTVLETSEQGSGETVESYEGSGETGSGNSDQHVPVYVDLSSYVPVSTFQHELQKRDWIISDIMDRYENVTNQMDNLEASVESIQLGNFMRSLQDTLINFTQNVITIDQWKVSSAQMVNSTLNNQDQIIKLTNMIVENNSKMSKLRGKLSTAEHMNDQQFNIARMYIIQLNNSVEELKESMKKVTQRLPMKAQNTQFSGYYGYRPSQRNPQYDDYEYYEQDTSSNILYKSLKSQVDNIGVQIVYNQNRLGQLEVKMLNESLYGCRKVNTDMQQDSKLAEHSIMIGGNMEAISLTHKMVTELDDLVRDVDRNLRSFNRKTRQNDANIQTLRRILPIMVRMRGELENFKFQLPRDCSEYYNRGHNETGIYVIYPDGASSSVRVTCHMTMSGGWTVIQHRYDGSVNFVRNWTDYRQGFGNVEREHWLGNDLIHQLTSQKNMSLHLHMVDIDDNSWTAEYDTFHVGSSDDKYVLTVTGYHGNATDGFSYASDMGFSTADRDNDASSTNCAFFYESGWWFKHCQIVNLNGRYHTGIGFVWFNKNTNAWVRLKSSIMKIKPKT